MKKLVLVTFVFVLAVVLMVVVFSARVASAQAAPNVFETKAACEAALTSGNFRHYEPRFFGLKDRDPVDGVKTVAIPLEHDQCLNTLVVGGHKFVVGKEGDVYRFRKNPDGSLTLYARNDCGNPAEGITIPAPPTPVADAAARTVAAPTDINVHVDGKVEVVHSGEVRVIHEGEVSVVHRKLREPAVDRGPVCGKKCKIAMVVIGGAAAGYAAWYYWPCPPGTTRK